MLRFKSLSKGELYMFLEGIYGILHFPVDTLYSNFSKIEKDTFIVQKAL